MKRIISVAVVFFTLAGTALAFSPQSIECLLTLGNQQYLLKKKLGSCGALAAIIADPAVTANPAELFGLNDDQAVLYRLADPFGPTTDLGNLNLDLGAPLYLILGLDPAAVWDLNVTLVKTMPDLILNILKGQTTIIGATYDPESGRVTMLGSHPDLLVLAVQHILGKPQTEATDTAEALATPTDSVPTEAETTVTIAEVVPETPLDASAKMEAATDKAPDQDQTEPKAAAQDGGSSAWGIIFFIIALIGAVVLMDKTVLKHED